MNCKSYFIEFLKYTSLNVFGMIGLSCYILADTFFVSKGLGVNGLTALNLAIPVYSFIHGIGLMLGMGGSTKYSIFKGQNDFENSDIVFTNTIYTAIILSFLFVFIGFFFCYELTLFLRADVSVANMTNTYIKIILLFSPAFIMNDIFICFVRNDGSPDLSMTAMFIGSIFNIIFDYIFIFPLNMGIFGAVLATGIAPIISMLILLKHYIKKQNGFHLKKTRFNPHIIFSNISLGIPSFVTELSSGIVIIVFNTIILTIAGNVGVAAYGIIANISLVVISIYTGIAQGIQPIISKAYGKNDKININYILRYSVVTIIIISAIIYLLIFVFADFITDIFNSEGNISLQNKSDLCLKLYFIAMPFVGFNIFISSFFTSVEKAFPAHMISVARGFFIIVPMAFLLSYFIGITGIWLAFPVTECIVFIMGIIIYNMKKVYFYV